MPSTHTHTWRHNSLHLLANGPGFHWETETEPDHDPSSNPRISMRFLLGAAFFSLFLMPFNWLVAHRECVVVRERKREGEREECGEG